MILDTDHHNYAGALPQELVDFARRQLVNAKLHRDDERRNAQRHTMMIPVVVVAVDNDNQPIATPFHAISRDVSATSIGLFHTDEISHDRIAIQLTLDGTSVNLVVALKWKRPMGPFYGSGGAYVDKLDQFPCDFEDSE